MGVFGKEKKKVKEDFGRSVEEPPRAPQLNFYTIGKTGTLAELRDANKQAIAYTSKPDEFDYSREFVQHLGADLQRELRRGAVDAFVEGKWDNLQAMMQSPEEFGIRDNYASSRYHQPEHDVRAMRATILAQVIRASKHVAADIQTAIAKLPQRDDQKAALELLVSSVAGTDISADADGFAQRVMNVVKIPEDQNAVQAVLEPALQQAVATPGQEETLKSLVMLALTKAPLEEVGAALNKTLYKLIANDGADQSIAALLEVGADANADINGDGYKGRLLATAVLKERSPEVIKLLHENGADFADALYLMKTKPDEQWGAGVRASLRTHAKKITGKLIEKAEVPSVLEQEMAELRDELTRTQQERDTANEQLRRTKSELSSATSKISGLESDVRRYKRRSTYGGY